MFLNQDLFESDLAGATVVTLFPSRDINRKLCPRLATTLKPGTRIVSYVHDMGDWASMEARTVQGAYGLRKLCLWIVAARP